jgi:DNA-binding transcriptional ArsR family regulator
MAQAQHRLRITDAEPASAPTLDDVVAIAKALADGVRVNVLRVLREESYGVLELCHILDLPQPALSHHLKVLHQAGLVARRREGNTIFYRRAPAPGNTAAALLAAIDAAALPESRQQRIDAVHAERSRRSELAPGVLPPRRAPAGSRIVAECAATTTNGPGPPAATCGSADLTAVNADARGILAQKNGFRPRNRNARADGRKEMRRGKYAARK